VCYESRDDELMDAMLFELQIEIRVGKAAGTPMLLGHDVTGLRLESAADLATPVPYSKAFDRQPAFWIGAMYFQVS